MAAIGQLPDTISLSNAIDSIGETVIIADKNYNVCWMNSKAVELLSIIAPLYGLTDANDLIGLNMNHFHRKPEHQNRIMDTLKDGHRTRITIKDKFVADIVISVIKNKDFSIEGYVVMLMDVTTKAEEEQKKERLIQALSIPILRVWKKTIALPLIGEFDTDRADRLISSVLKECAANGIQFVLIDLSGLYNFDLHIRGQIQKLIDCLKLIGTECIIVGITPELAQSIIQLENSIPTFNSAHAGLEYIINRQSSSKE
ncbi:anti-anti-sigma regulatory factor [Peribacillus deserti]|uniref:Anti-anti-sigma regulatory factor n=1 Tax=Peribacillus deserti TaxID=673318 RepID=A0ABS2QFP3_9BACI|nr:STAS domain-containing protein [Peribacillus deserti]MBM7691121.1 anti-anti-sigma regulatory factor [Peribacillus deserti]